MPESVAFFSLEETVDKKGYIGAILVTDELGMPEEFRVSYPVKPTAIQKQLYGDSLLVHIGVTLCGVPLYRALKNQPELMVIKDKSYLRISDSVDSSVVYIERVGEAFKIRDTDESDISGDSYKLRSKSGRFQPVSVSYPSIYDETKRKDTNILLNKYFQSIDLHEPFDRIKNALAALASQDERFR